MLINNPEGHYQFQEGSSPYSCGVVADEDWHVVHATLRTGFPWREGFDRVGSYLATAGLPPAAVCGIELRCPEPYSIEGFAAFNDIYYACLEEKGLLVDGLNPIARTNVAPVLTRPPEQHLHAFSYVTPSEGMTGRTFVVSGAGELRSMQVAGDAIVRRGENSREALVEKASCVAEAMRTRLDGLGCCWEDVTRVNVYTDHHAQVCIDEVLQETIQSVRRLGVNLLAARPPVADILFEMDMRGVRQEVWI